MEVCNFQSDLCSVKLFLNILLNLYYFFQWEGGKVNQKWKLINEAWWAGRNSVVCWNADSFCIPIRIAQTFDVITQKRWYCGVKSYVLSDAGALRCYGFGWTSGQGMAQCRTCLLSGHYYSHGVLLAIQIQLTAFRSGMWIELWRVCWTTCCNTRILVIKLQFLFRGM